MRDDAERLRAQGLSIRQIADELGVPRSTVGDALRGLHALPTIVEEVEEVDPRLTTLTKVCARCREPKTWAEFCAKTKWPDGTMRQPQSRCNACLAAVNRERRRSDPEWAGRIDRRNWERIQADRAKAARRRETQRENSVAFRRKNGAGTRDEYLERRRVA